jgi:signal peptidase I
MAPNKIAATSEHRNVRTASRPGSSPRPAPAEQGENKTLAVTVKETLESIVVAFILAFVFRAFIVEAFVIPTGSMAVTLYGKQLTKTCSTCGYEYAYGLVDGKRNTETRVRCPNCRVLYDKFSATELDRADSGDRILVHKWPLDLPGGWLGPNRWEVTVFKDPEDGTTNFIKRLVGMPGEALEIIDGDVYTAKMENLPAELIGQFEQLRELIYRYGHGDRQPGSSDLRDEIRDLYAKINKKLLPCLEIQRKIEQAPRAQESLWFNVYNHDFLPSYELRADQNKPPVGWAPDSPDAAKAWKDTNRRTIKFDSVSDDTLFLKFEGTIDDFYAYNFNDSANEAMDLRGGGPSGRCLVGDVRLRFSWIIRAGSGDLVLEMNRDKDTFIASISTTGKVKLELERPVGESATRRETIAEPPPLDSFSRDRAVQVEFINVDYRVMVLIDGKIVAKSNDKQYHPLVERLERFCQPTPTDAVWGAHVEPTVVRIGGRNMQCDLKHLVLERDVYYRSQPLFGGPWKGTGLRLPDWSGWGTAGHPILLRPQRVRNGKTYAAEYFMLGDNSPHSKDSRLWESAGSHLIPLMDEYQLGTVPEDQLIGKAFFVYWPAGYRAAWTGGIGLIPNFGRMRWIR